MRAEPARLNSTIASLFMLGASCFALGTIPAYVHAVGANADAMTFFVGSIFFTSASYWRGSPISYTPAVPIDRLGEDRGQGVLVEAVVRASLACFVAVASAIVTQPIVIVRQREPVCTLELRRIVLETSGIAPYDMCDRIERKLADRTYRTYLYVDRMRHKESDGIRGVRGLPQGRTQVGVLRQHVLDPRRG